MGLIDMSQVDVVGGGLAAIAMIVVVQGAFKFAASRKGNPGRNNELCRQHAERLATLEESHKSLEKGQTVLFDKVSCIDRKVSRLLTLSEQEE